MQIKINEKNQKLKFLNILLELSKIGYFSKDFERDSQIFLSIKNSNISFNYLNSTQISKELQLSFKEYFIKAENRMKELNTLKKLKNLSKNKVINKDNIGNCSFLHYFSKNNLNIKRISNIENIDISLKKSQENEFLIFLEKEFGDIYKDKNKDYLNIFKSICNFQNKNSEQLSWIFYHYSLHISRKWLTMIIKNNLVFNNDDIYYFLLILLKPLSIYISQQNMNEIQYLKLKFYQFFEKEFNYRVNKLFFEKYKHFRGDSSVLRTIINKTENQKILIPNEEWSHDIINFFKRINDNFNGDLEIDAEKLLGDFFCFCMNSILMVKNYLITLLNYFIVFYYFYVIIKFFLAK